jgi:hypothetical protein
MAEINELKKNVEEGELKDEALDGAAGGSPAASFATVLNIDPEDGIKVNPIDSKDTVGTAQILRF